MTFPPRIALVLVGLASSASVAMALYAQHRMGMEPCPWCILQRMVFIVIAIVALVAALQPWQGLRRALSGLVVLLCGAGVAAAWWQHTVASKSSSCALTLADKIITAVGVDTRWPDVLEVRANCAEAAVDLWGVPFELWSLALFAALGLIAVLCTLARNRRRA